MQQPPDSLTGDYFGIVYRGGPIIPLLLLALLLAGGWWLWKQRKRAH